MYCKQCGSLFYLLQLSSLFHYKYQKAIACLCLGEFRVIVHFRHLAVGKAYVILIGVPICENLLLFSNESR